MSTAAEARNERDLARGYRLDPEVIAAARERWRLSDAIGHRVKLRRRGAEWVGLCPFHDEHTPSFTVRDDKGFFHCFGCGVHGDLIGWVMRSDGVSFHDAVTSLNGDYVARAPRTSSDTRSGPTLARDPDLDRRIMTAREIWYAASAIAGTPAERYLRGRRIAIPLPRTLRFHPELLHGTKGDYVRLPALVGAVQDLNGRIVGVHRIYLDPATAGGDAPQKTSRTPGKQLLGDVKGGAVRLTAWAPRMGTCEGIETGLSVLQAWPDQALWCGIDTGHMAKVEWPIETEHLTVFADRDRADMRSYLVATRSDGSTWRRRNPNYGRRAGEHWARATANRFVEAARGRTASSRIPPGEKSDFNDLLQGSAA